MKNNLVVVTGASGFIGNHLVSRLVSDGYSVNGVDIKHPEFGETAADSFQQLDLRDYENCLKAFEGADAIYALAADMGGMGYISKNHASILRNNFLINSNTLEAAKVSGIKKFVISSSACVYPEHLQVEADCISLKEQDAYPANPQDGLWLGKINGREVD